MTGYDFWYYTRSVNTTCGKTLQFLMLKKVDRKVTVQFLMLKKVDRKVTV